MSIDPESLRGAEQIAGLAFTDEERALALEQVQKTRAALDRLRAHPLDNSVPPALRFSALFSGTPDMGHREAALPAVVPEPQRPANDNDLAFLPVTHLSHLLRSRQVSSVELTRMYLDRLARYDRSLHCVVTLTEERALEQASKADAELAQGIIRGPLHGIPWGAKDLLAVRGYPTTWGSVPFQRQVIDKDATVVKMLDDAGAVLVAKLTLGELAMGDVWFGGRTNNPWNLDEGSSGSSAGPGSATAAGLVGFSLGSETRGSIISPSTRCGVTGLRPTFGRVSRHGAMALSWSMDKIGPMCRSVDDCALVFDAIAGTDGHDMTVTNAPFTWPTDIDLQRIRVGYLKRAFDAEREDAAWRENDDTSLRALRSLGITLIPIDLPDCDVEAMNLILSVEAAAAFDDLTRNGRDDDLVRQGADAWPNIFRVARYIPAVEYLQANRLRTLAMRKMAAVFENVDVYVAPTFGNDNLALTNLTGHPAVVVPNGFHATGSPTSITFTGGIQYEEALLAIARAYQEATNFHLQHPVLQDDA